MEIKIKLKTPHEKQQKVLKNRKRFNTLKCGRRFGKTTIIEELISEVIERGQFIGIWSPTNNDSHEVWQEVKAVFGSIITYKNETIKQAIFLGGAKVDFWSMENPDSGRGRKYHRAVVDECEKALKFKDAWLGTIRATLADFTGDAYFLSTPKFGDTYFKEISKNHLTMDDWATFVFKTSDNPYISKAEIESIRAMYANNPLIYECEYEAADVDGLGENPFAFNYNSDFHESERAVFNPNRRAIISIDFNLNPFACTISHVWEDESGLHDHTFYEFSIENGSVPAMAERLKNTLGGAISTAIVTGDAMGRARNISQSDNASNYQLLKKLTGIPESSFYVKHNPTHDKSRNDVNTTLFAATQPLLKVEKLINPKTCPQTIADYKGVQCDSFGQIIKRNRKESNQRADFLDTERYKIHYFVAPKVEKIIKNAGYRNILK